MLSLGRANPIPPRDPSFAGLYLLALWRLICRGPVATLWWFHNRGGAYASRFHPDIIGDGVDAPNSRRNLSRLLVLVLSGNIPG
jgi:hypothetical protein